MAEQVVFMNAFVQTRQEYFHFHDNLRNSSLYGQPPYTDKDMRTVGRVGAVLKNSSPAKDTKLHEGKNYPGFLDVPSVLDSESRHGYGVQRIATIEKANSRPGCGSRSRADAAL